MGLFLITNIMALTFKIIQISLAILLVIVILMQQKGSGLGLAFGAETTVKRTRRGAESVLYWATVVIAVLFCTTALFTVFFS